MNKIKTDPVIIILDIVILILIFVTIVTGARFIFYRNIANDLSFSQKAEMMSFELERGDYAALIQGKYINEINGNSEAGEYHALADYIEAASRYKVYDAKKYKDRAAQQEKIMTDARQKMGELTVFADRIDDTFGIL